jgi:hypothetical protein
MKKSFEEQFIDYVFKLLGVAVEIYCVVFFICAIIIIFFVVSILWMLGVIDFKDHGEDVR